MEFKKAAANQHPWREYRKEFALQRTAAER